MSWSSLPVELQGEIFRFRFSRGLVVRIRDSVCAGDGRRQGKWKHNDDGVPREDFESALTLLAVSRGVRAEFIRILSIYVEIHFENLYALDGFCELFKPKRRIPDLIVPARLTKVSVGFGTNEWRYVTDPWNLKLYHRRKVYNHTVHNVEKLESAAGKIGELSPQGFSFVLLSEYGSLSEAGRLALSMFLTVLRASARFPVKCPLDKLTMVVRYNGKDVNRGSIEWILTKAGLSGLASKFIELD